MKLDALVAPLRADVVSGAAVVARTAAEVVRRATGRIPADDVEELRAGLGELFVKILDAQPAMAPLVALGSEVLEAVEGAGTVEEGRRAAAEAAGSFREEVEERTAAVGRRAAELIPEGGTVLTLSSSSTVRAALLEHAGEGGGLRVICLEGRPLREGRNLAVALARAGIEVTVAVDAAGGSLLPEANLVLLGADSIGDRGVVNKIGSRLVALEARRLGISVIVTADRTKLLPPGFPQPTADDRPGDEVWRAPAGPRVWNRYFEVVPADAVSTVVTDRESLSAGDVEPLRRSLSVPPELRAWAEGHGSEPEG